MERVNLARVVIRSIYDGLMISFPLVMPTAKMDMVPVSIDQSSSWENNREKVKYR